MTAQNRERSITGIVHEECSLPHSPPWGNWGVISDYGRKRDGFQFPGWWSSDAYPEFKYLAAAACREFLLRQRLNDAARALAAQMRVAARDLGVAA